ncbi:MAG: alpha-L-fucosidase [Verrucomicrobiales bacterium]|nr:alpha-L-fucosidase [Verrucomicrobiales bacterium]
MTRILVSRWLGGFTAWVALLSSSLLAAPAPVPGIPVPTPNQIAWHEAGVGLFFHWAPNVYQGGEGDNLSTPRTQINPDRFDAQQWVEAVQAANAGYMIFVAKHGGGYCTWQTKTTDYSIKTSPWKEGRGDMLAELAKACQEDQVALGVYLGPYDETHGAGVGGRTKDPTKQSAYKAIYRQQLTEILTQYGPMFEMWFDGGNIVPINDIITKHAPGIISFQGRMAGGSRWVGTEHGFAPYPCWNTIDWKEGETPKEGAGTPTGNAWCPAECDVSILRPRWFWSPGSDKNILSLDSLSEIYYLSVGRGVNLLLNATPDSHGEVPAAQMTRLREFGDDIRARFAKPLAVMEGEGDGLTLDLSGEKTVDHLVLREDIAGGERVRKFMVEGKRKNGKSVVLARGSQIGVRQIIPIPAVAVTELRLKIEGKVAPVTIREFAAFHVDRPVPALAYREGGQPAMRAPTLSRSRDGHFAIESPTPAWEIRYTLDGSEPGRKSLVYREPQRLPLGGILKARYFDTENPSSSSAGGPVVSRRFGLPPSQISVVKASSEENDTPAGAAFDGDPKTMWHTAWRSSTLPPPHEVVVDLGKSWSVNGLAYLSRQDAVGNFPSAISVWASEKPDAFAERPQFEGSFANFKKDPQTWRQLEFPRALQGRYLRVVYLDEVNHAKCVATAELEILVNP